MHSGETALLNFPDWYRVEKDTEKTVRKLSSVKELSFYLKNSDSCVRRLAILRINELKLKDSIDVLKEILDDHLESMSNKELAAWTIKTVSLRHNIDIFISSKLLNKYTGNEKYSDIYKVTIHDSITSVNFDFQADLLNSELRSDYNDIRSSEDIVFDTRFNSKEWFAAWLQGLQKLLMEVVVSTPGNTFKLLKASIIIISKGNFVKWPYRLFHKIMKCIFYKPLNKRKKMAEAMIGLENNISPNFVPIPANNLESLRPKDNSCFKKGSNKTSFVAFLKELPVNVLFYAFSPVRLFLRHRVFSAACLILIYVFLTYTTPGKIITYKNFGLDLKDIQSNTLQAAEEIMSYALFEIKELAGINNKAENIKIVTKSQSPSPSQEKRYRVTARTGLNLRTAPDENSQKADKNMLVNNSVVTFLSKTQKDSAGRVWYLVKTEGGISGWVYSKWLVEVGGGENAGK